MRLSDPKRSRREIIPNGSSRMRRSLQWALGQTPKARVLAQSSFRWPSSDLEAWDTKKFAPGPVKITNRQRHFTRSADSSCSVCSSMTQEESASLWPTSTSKINTHPEVDSFSHCQANNTWCKANTLPSSPSNHTGELIKSPQAKRIYLFTLFKTCQLDDSKSGSAH